jgi:hypothetical protein
MDSDLAELLGERACERLVVEYARRVDFGEASTIADLFVEDGVWTGVDLRLDGRNAIREWFSRREALDRRVSRHVHTNVAVRIDADGARAQALSYLINYRHDRREGDRGMPAPGDVPKYVGECRDTFVRTEYGWRFAARDVAVAFVRPGRPRR